LNKIDDHDAQYFLLLAQSLLKDINMSLLWSCVCCDDFGYERVIASSTAVKGEFNKLKNNVKNYILSVRVDEFIKIYLDFLYDKLKIVHAEENSMFLKNESTCINKKKKEMQMSKLLKLH